tara:strand:- start:525 stop:1001 length:477 start_codon:yes stop_codon:yes gene_type:complete
MQVILRDITGIKSVEASDKNRELLDYIFNKYPESKNDYVLMLDYEYPNETEWYIYLFDPDGIGENLSDEWEEEIAVPYQRNSFGEGIVIDDSKFFALTKNVGKGWYWGQEPYPDEFYLKVAEIFGEYGWSIYLYEDTSDTEEELIVRITKDEIDISTL